MENISLKDKCKGYQKEFDFRLDTDKWILVHIDGKNFSKMVKNRFKKPFDDDFINAMNETAKYLCEVQGVKFAYVQSDEISLLMKKDTPESDVFYGGRLSKIQSVLASMATSKFNQIMQIRYFNELIAKDGYNFDVVDELNKQPLYSFDCKAWTVDNANDAMAWFLFRNIDCVRNSKNQSAQTYMSHSELWHKTSDEMIEMLKLHYNIDWNRYDEGKKYGRYIVKETYTYNMLKPEAQLANEAAYEAHKSILENGGCVLIENDPEDYIEVTRSRWKAVNGFDLTLKENREKLMEICPSFKED